MPFSIGKFISFKIRQFHWWIFQWTNRIDGFLPICGKNLPMENGISNCVIYRYTNIMNSNIASDKSIIHLNVGMNMGI